MSYKPVRWEVRTGLSQLRVFVTSVQNNRRMLLIVLIIKLSYDNAMMCWCVFTLDNASQSLCSTMSTYMGSEFPIYPNYWWICPKTLVCFDLLAEMLHKRVSNLSSLLPFSSVSEMYPQSTFRWSCLDNENGGSKIEMISCLCSLLNRTKPSTSRTSIGDVHSDHSQDCVFSIGIRAC